MVSFMLFSTIRINWGIIASIITVLAFAYGASKGASQWVHKWRVKRRLKEEEDNKVQVAIFGSKASPPYGPVDGLLMEHANTIKVLKSHGEQLEELRTKVAGVESTLSDVEQMVTKLVSRTEENGGSSIKDQLNRICESMGIANPPKAPDAH